MLNKILIGLLILSALWCLTGMIARDVFVYIIGFVFICTMLCFMVMALVANIGWRRFGQELETKYKTSKERFYTIVLLSVPFFILLSRKVTKNYLSGSSELIVYLCRGGILAFTMITAWSLIKKAKWVAIFAEVFFLILFIAVLSFVGSLKSGKVDSKDSYERLGTIGYVDWVDIEREKESDAIKSGVIKNESAAFDGDNLYVSSGENKAYLINMKGDIVHQWSQDIDEGNSWIYAELCENGDLLVVADDEMLICLDWESNVRWTKDIKAHHDVFVDQDRNIYALGREDALIYFHGLPVPILSDYFLVLSPEGKTKKKLSLYELLDDEVMLSGKRVVKIYKWILQYDNLKKIFKRKRRGENLCKNELCDITHLNSIEILDRDIDGFCNKGDWLISMRECDLICVLDSVKEKVVWAWGPGEVSKQHHPTLLDNGNILIFDNGPERGYTRIIELDPLEKEIVWLYKGEPGKIFFSEKRGGCQRLPNGNTLISESDKGHVFEITQKGEVVWEFYNPNINEEKQKRGAIYRMERIWNFKKPLLNNI